MRCLLDTNAWLWMTLVSDRLGPETRALVAKTENELRLSVVSAWEIVIKARLGKLEVVGEPEDFIRTRLRLQGIASLPVSLDHVLTVGHLAPHHRDPFDRLIIAQAVCEGLLLVTGDERLRAYDDVRYHDART